MAKVKNITLDSLSLFSVDAPPVLPGDIVTVRDEAFVERAWPSSVWEVVEPPAIEGVTEAVVEDAHLWTAQPGTGEEPEHLDAPSFEVLSATEPVEVIPDGPLPVEGALVDEPLAGTGEAINADTGEVIAPGDPLPEISSMDGDPLPELYDPGAHRVAEVSAYLASADPAERARVIEAEAAGKARKTITEWSE